MVTKEFLIEEFVTKNKSAEQIGKDLGLSDGTIHHHLRKFNIKKDRCTKFSKEFLEQEFVKNGKSSAQIAKEVGADRKTVCYYIIKYKLREPYPLEKLTKEVMEELYIKQNLSITDIANKLNIKCYTSIPQAAKKYGLKREKVRRKWAGYEEISFGYIERIKDRCKRKQIKMGDDFTKEYIWELFIKQNRKCIYSGIELQFAKDSSVAGRRSQTASLDRIDSTKGYEIGNVQWVHKTVNKMKQNLDEKVFLEFCNLIAKNLESYKL